MTPTEHRQQRLDDHLGQQEAKARWYSDWWNSVAVAAAAVPGAITREPTPAETLLERMARWHRDAAAKQAIIDAEDAATTAAISKWWNETHPIK